jgi:hypothetical protein
MDVITPTLDDIQRYLDREVPPEDHERARTAILAVMAAARRTSSGLPPGTPDGQLTIASGAALPSPTPESIQRYLDQRIPPENHERVRGEILAVFSTTATAPTPVKEVLAELANLKRGRGSPKKWIGAHGIQLIKEVEAVRTSCDLKYDADALRIILEWRGKIKGARRYQKIDKKVLREWQSILSKARKFHGNLA